MALKGVVQQQGAAGGRLGRLGSSDVHDDHISGFISRAQQLSRRRHGRLLYPCKNTLLSLGITYQYSEIALITMKLL